MAEISKFMSTSINNISKIMGVDKDILSSLYGYSISAGKYYGTGSDGDVIISGSVNLHTDTVASGRSYADMICYNVTSLSQQSATVSTTVNGIVAGDEVLLLNIQGILSSYVNTGNYETFTVSSVSGSVVSFSESKTKYYGDGALNDTNIGTGATNQKVILQRIPNYDLVTVNVGGTITANVFDGNKGGMLFFRVKDTLVVSGTITMSSNGYRYGRGGSTHQHGWRGESLKPRTQGYGSNNVGGGSGGRCVDSTDCRGGAGAGYGSVGGNGGGLAESPGGSTYGEAAVDSGIYLGSGGGGPAYWYNQHGGAGGGLIYIAANICNIYNIISTNGADGTGRTAGSSGAGGGGGTGGCLLLHVGVLTMGSSTVTATGGTGGPGSNWGNTGVGGAGGVGRIAIYYDTLTDSISTNPAAYTG